ncbi:MAG: VWA-like domain-containing protein [Candidatus Thiodiazotropha taylori]|nr:VWA-like domain-containing protein [Candidatus Thiodiazotropha taylori]MCG7936224.1 VWA-like domain-containing protein [Candidatus Thiodiazotropha taylori]MCG7972697.1 VWA-like domain-containing protein [Candidatus Thiodiazotropha taylori]
MDQDEIETKLAAARTKLILDKPFLGALVMRLPMQEANPDWCPTTATDAKSFYYNPEYIDQLSLDETQFMLAHEALHCALSHFARRQHRTKLHWDMACDYAINPLLTEDGLKPPPGSLMLPQFSGMTAEEIYPCLDEKSDDEPLDNHVYDQDNTKGSGSGKSEKDMANSQQQNNNEQEGDEESNPQSGSGKAASQPPPLSPDEAETLNIQWQQRMAGAAQQAMQAGKLDGAIARMVDHLLQPQLPWRLLLARYMTALARDDFSYQRPSRREGEFILPSLRSNQLELVVALDTSGSIQDQEMGEFLAEVNALKGQMRARVTLLACDSAIAEEAPWIYESWEEFELPEKITGGGGTSFKPVFEWIAEQDLSPDLVVYFTDAEGAFPPHEPHYPVIWLVKGKHKTPWGQRIQLN